MKVFLRCAFPTMLLTWGVPVKHAKLVGPSFYPHVYHIYHNNNQHIDHQCVQRLVNLVVVIVHKNLLHLNLQSDSFYEHILPQRFASPLDLHIQRKIDNMVGDYYESFGCAFQLFSIAAIT